MANLTPNTGEWHVRNVGIILSNLQHLEFLARSVIAAIDGSGAGVDLRAVKAGDWVPETPVTNYDQLRDVLKDYNARASANHQVDVERLIALRDAFAHGRLIASGTSFPLTLVKFGPAKSGAVPVTTRIDMTSAWFDEMRTFVDSALDAIAMELVDRNRQRD
jgi:hypothetical protein